jgi:hypothetical protein
MPVPNDVFCMPRWIQIMTDKPIKIPGPDHPISIEPNRSHVVVQVGGKVIADTSNALTLREGLLSARSVYPPSGCRYGRAHAQRTHNVLSLQGRRPPTTAFRLAVIVRLMRCRLMRQRWNAGSPATTMTSKSGRSAPEGKSQPRVNSRCRSERIQSRTLVPITVIVVERLHLLDLPSFSCAPTVSWRPRSIDVRRRPPESVLANRPSLGGIDPKNLSGHQGAACFVATHQERCPAILHDLRVVRVAH